MRNNISTLILIYGLASFIRWWLGTSEFQQELQQRIEIITPVNSIKRVIEGEYRLKYGLDAYSSDVLHESPIHLQFYMFLMHYFGDYLLFVFIFFDILTAHALYIFAKRHMFELYMEQEKTKHTYANDAADQLIKGKELYLPSIYVVVVYLFNPYTIFNCVSLSTTAISNLLIALFFVGLIYCQVVFCVAILTLATMHLLYPVILLSPIYLNIYKKYKSHFRGVAAILLYFAFLGGTLYYAKMLYGGWGYLEHTFGFILSVPDQQPNVGVFWYFFMEMFEHFRLLFLCAYQMNVTVLYFIPLSIKFRKNPILLAACFVTLIAIFKSYPSIGDFSLTLALLPCWKHLYNCMQQIFISSITIIVTTALSPILWDLWIYWGTANANFFFGTTLGFITAHIFLITDISFAISKREYLLKYGNCRKINGKEARLVLE